MHATYDPIRVAISIIIAVFFAFVSFEAVDGIQRGAGRLAWICSGGVTLGLGIWSMHFVGMNAYRIAVPIYYNVKITILSALPAIAASCLALYLASELLRQRVLIYASMLMGAGIAAMHYLGMAAAEIEPRPAWKPGMVLLSFLVAIAASGIALTLYSFSLRRKQFTVKLQFSASLVIAAAICGMHYIGMAAMCLPDHLVAIQPKPGYVDGSDLARVGVWAALVMLFSVLVISRDQKQRWVESLNDERLMALEVAKRSEKLVLAGKMSATIAHEINNPLGALMNLIYLAQQEPTSTQAQAEYLGSAQRELGRVSQITAHALKFYRQSSGPTPVALESMLDSVLALFAGRIAQAGVTIEPRFRGVPPVTCCEGEIRQVLTNLIANALDALEDHPRPRILLRARRVGQTAVLSVADNGGGIPADVRARLFEPFYTTKGERGTGLGLWVSKEIMERHQGSLTFRSNAQGTVFQLRLPLSPEHGPTARPARASEALHFASGAMA